MSARIEPVFQSGDTCRVGGLFIFNGFLDGQPGPLPETEELTILLRSGEEFPDIGAGRKKCWWTPCGDAPEI